MKKEYENLLGEEKVLFIENCIRFNPHLTSIQEFFNELDKEKTFEDFVSCGFPWHLTENIHGQGETFWESISKRKFA